MIEYLIFKLGCLTNSEKKRLSVKMRSKQQAYIHVVRSTWNMAIFRSREQGYGLIVQE